MHGQNHIKCEIDISLTVHLGIILVNNQLDALFSNNFNGNKYIGKKCVMFAINKNCQIELSSCSSRKVNTARNKEYFRTITSESLPHFFIREFLQAVTVTILSTERYFFFDRFQHFEEHSASIPTSLS